ncbi:TetR/AcrR family transcriptional regulator [Cellulosimicrobium arenosum]|uniref:TetR/AcrR family transcriptional regulator n=1 Tax=Cellulosimicrobium arenosum TaxID=2708133 RepID=A0A927GAN8_9MICO|nr:TetR/AcrR family transcriptional regulator [Cellulosimicrobium arenosum]MBD8079310.1 TetR/AcrR family transcriptional regulator [Cellulosimicrobium arenosum]
MVSTSLGTGSPGGLRERKKRRRRDALVDAAQSLVLERGLDAVTVEDVCEAVGVSPRTFFNYFPSKDDAVLGLEDLVLTTDAAADFEAGGPTGVLLDDLARLVEDIIGQQAVSPERMHRALELVEREPRLIARHIAWIDEHRVELVALCVRRREAHPFTTAPELVALVALTMMRAVGEEWHRRERRGSPSDLLPSVTHQLRALLDDPAPAAPAAPGTS